MLGRVNLSFWNRHRRRSRGTWRLRVEVDQSDLWTSQGCKDRGRSTLIPSSEVRKHGSEVFTVESHPKCPTLYYVREADGVIELHVDDGHGCGKETIVAELLTFLSEKIEMKYVQGIWCGSYEYLKTVKVRDGKKLTSIPNKKHFQSSFEKVGDERLQGECFSKIGQGVHRW